MFQWPKYRQMISTYQIFESFFYQSWNSYIIMFFGVFRNYYVTHPQRTPFYLSLTSRCIHKYHFRMNESFYNKHPYSYKVELYAHQVVSSCQRY